MEGDREKKITQDDDVVKSDQGLIFDPYNPLNREAALGDVEGVLTRYGVPGKIHNLNLYIRAFVHRSYCRRPAVENAVENITVVGRPDDCMPLRTKSNERLEFVGDGVLECIVKYYLYKRFPKADEGFMTEKKIALVRNEHIGKLALEMGLHRWYIISKHAEEKKTRTNLKKLGCLFEAFLGALFLDFNKISVKDEDGWFASVFTTGPGFHMAQVFVENILEKHVNWTQLIQTDDNFKNILQVKLQKGFRMTPHYLELGRDVDAGYLMGVYLCLGQAIHETDPSQAIPYQDLGSFEMVNDRYEQEGKILVFMGKGEHKIKRKAEQMACEYALELCNK